MKKVYIAGPMTGYPDYNFPAFMVAEDRLRRIGYEVINPARIDHKDKDDWASCMRQAITEMLKADDIITLPNWYYSKGASIEVDLAMKLGIPVTDYHKVVARMGLIPDGT